MSTYVSVEISPATTTRPVVIRVSHATRPLGSSFSTASSTESDTWSAILSGWPSVTDSDVKRNSRAAIAAGNATYSMPTKTSDLTRFPSLSPYATSERSGSRFRETSGGTVSPESEAKPVIRSIVCLRSTQARPVY